MQSIAVHCKCLRFVSNLLDNGCHFMVDYFLCLICLVLTCLVKLPSAIYPYYKFTTIVNALPLLHATYI